ncbi:MAG: DnaA/Hda family protein [Patescibacteria group bacterium]
MQKSEQGGNIMGKEQEVRAFFERFSEKYDIPIYSENKEEQHDNHAPRISLVNLAKQDYQYRDVDPTLTFDAFVVGKTNEYAARACRKIADGNPSSSFRFLFIAGPTASGKTHLEHAIANEIAHLHRPCHVVWREARNLQSEFVRLSCGDGGRRAVETHYDQHYRNADVFLLDNLHFLTGQKTQEMFASLFDVLRRAKEPRVMVITSIASITDLPIKIPEFVLQDELRSRITSMTTLPVDWPDEALLADITAQKAQCEGLTLPRSITERIAAFAYQFHDVRKIEGVLASIKSVMELSGKSVEEVWEEWGSREQRTLEENVNFLELVQIVADVFQVRQQAILQKQNRGNAGFARKVVMLLCVSLLCPSEEKLAWLLGENVRDVRNHLREAGEKLKKSPAFAEKMRQAHERLQELRDNPRVSKPF